MIRVSTVLCIAITFSNLTLAEEIRHRFIAADSSQNRIAIIDESGKTEWEHKIGPLHDLHVLSNGNLLFQTNWTSLIEIEPETGRTIWKYDSSTGKNQGHRVEVHAFQRLANGNTMIAESGVSRIIEVDVRGNVVHEMPLVVSDPHPHRDTRLARQLSDGNYLVCHEGDGVVREYSRDGKIVWEYSVPLFDRAPAKGHGVEGFGNQCFAALRRSNGNTLITTGNGHRVIEVTPSKEIVWSLTQNELPGIQFAWITTLQELPNGNLVIGNCHAGKDNPQIVEITRDKEVVWQFQDFERFGNALTNTQILSTNGRPVVAPLGSHR